MKNKISIPVIEDVSVEAKEISIGLKKKNLHSNFYMVGDIGLEPRRTTWRAYVPCF